MGLTGFLALVRSSLGLVPVQELCRLHDGPNSQACNTPTAIQTQTALIWCIKGKQMLSG